MVNHAVLSILGIPGLGQLVDHVHVPGETACPTDSTHRWQAAKVHADANRDAAFLSRPYHLLHLIFVTQVAGVQPQAVHPARRAFKGQLVVEVYVCDEGDVDLLFDFPHGLGSFHVWHKDEINELLAESSRQLFCRSYGLAQAPNFEGKAWHLVRRLSAGELAKASGDSEQAIEQALEEARSVLVSAREKRVHPTLDGKRLTSWNALLTEGLVRAGLALDRDDWLESADQIIEFIHRESWDGERLFAVYYAGEVRFAAYLDDYAWLLNAIMFFLQARWKDQYLRFATRLGDALLARFQDPEHGGFFFSDAAVEVPIARSMIFQDDATPAGNAIAVSALQKLGALTGELHYTKAAQRCLARSMDLLGQSPLACTSLLPVLQESVNPRPHIIISGTDVQQCEALKQWVNTGYQVDCYLIGQAQDSLPGILSQYLSCEPVTAWVCHGMRCMPPAESREALKQRLEETNGSRHQDGTGPRIRLPG